MRHNPDIFPDDTMAYDREKTPTAGAMQIEPMSMQYLINFN
jgi:hypothetical protein